MVRKRYLFSRVKLASELQAAMTAEKRERSTACKADFRMKVWRDDNGQ